MQLFAFALPPAPLPRDINDRLMALLPVEAQERIQRFRLPEDGLRSLVSRLAPTWYLRYTNLIAHDQVPTFGREGKGKPKLLDPELSPPLAFNDSHDGSYVLLGIARGQDTVIGVDLMQLPTDPLPVQEGISEQLLAAEKRALPSDLSMNDRARRVTTFWTVKEGYTKAIGEGIGFGLERIRVDLDERGEVRMVCVDGRDVRDDGWRWECGWLGRDEGYGWVVFWKGDEEKEVGEEDGVTNQVKDIAWTEFLCQFDET